ncbi:23S rRNA (pseudouridine(1915)-N(3))-methyltransferase RlmH [Oceanicoccus sagamiensis]|uniref:Ribosomal RNA large subunit methyltransferase H n=1 Tax=Oceanicoccus sagamiensis TaxID=716816 RepID=A0A1X9NE26_9GAMM|nr:23S rRNA (pseudouridine(1915)-N(3))-methyltransferase RlmH [Oceanicoccus sagamiensis]ARN74682.1 23S rRNA (pseudouridine(1915)-N(3))-methyltransferase RlmH [Oceanicoccus sagamiensis]
MRIRVIAVGTKMPKWVEQGVDEYTKRLPPELKLEFKEIALGKRGKGADIARAINSEGQQMLAAIGQHDRVIALDVLGKPWATEKLAGELRNWQLEGDNISLLVGGPDGLAAECLQRANQRWSLSALTLPHPLVRIVLAEQLYRAWTINSHHPYHR